MSKAAISRAVAAIQKWYPPKLADSSWDNTGLLVEAFSETVSGPLKILLTIDLTQSVVDEAISSKTNLILAYHPFIFRGLKSITTGDPQQRSLLRLIKNDISVYSPHTAVDSVDGGVNDFLVSSVTKDGEVASKMPIIPNLEETKHGMGRVAVLKEPILLDAMVSRAKQSLSLSHVQVAVAHNQDKFHQIKTIAVCAGSGGSVFKGCKADLYLTGELSHHEALYFKESGSSVIVCNHSNTERAFLKEMKNALCKDLPDAMIDVSESDTDPFDTW